MTRLLFPCPSPAAGDEVTALSLWEPWASAMRTGAKAVETRSWTTSYRGPLLICAALRRDSVGLELLGAPQWQNGLAPLRRPGQRFVTHGDLLFGMAVALVDLVNIRTTDSYAPEAVRRITGEEFFGDYRPGRFAWVTSNLRLFDPFPVRGGQGLFRVRLPADFSPRVPRPAEVHQ